MMEAEKRENSKRELNKGPWQVEEDRLLIEYVAVHGEGKWATVSKRSGELSMHKKAFREKESVNGLMRGGKSCRLRWMNHLRPNKKHGGMSEEEEDLIIRLHKLLGNRWSLIAGRLPGRTDNDVKNHWNTRLSKKLGRRDSYSKPIWSSGRTHQTNGKKRRSPTEFSPTIAVTQEPSYLKEAKGETVVHEGLIKPICSNNNDSKVEDFIKNINNDEQINKSITTKNENTENDKGGSEENEWLSYAEFDALITEETYKPYLYSMDLMESFGYGMEYMPWGWPQYGQNVFHDDNNNVNF